MNTPVRALGRLDVFCLGLNAIIGSGIFLFPGMLAALAGPASVAAFLFCGVLLAAVALCYAELSSMCRENGASAVYARTAFGDEAGFCVGLIAWAAACLSWAAVASILAGHLSYFHPAFSNPVLARAIAAAGIAGFGLLNYRGIKPGAKVVNFLTLAKSLPLLLFVLAGLFYIEPARFTPFFGGENDFGKAVFLALWALQGFEVAPIPAGETSDPQRDVPIAVVGSLIAATVFYVLIQTVAVGTYPALSLSTERPLADVAAFLFGAKAGTLMVLAGIISMTGFIAGAALGAPRYLSALGERSLKAWRLAAAHPRFGTPHRAIAATTGAAVGLVVFLDFSSLIDLSNLAVVSQYFFSCLALCVLRIREPRRARPYRVPAVWFVAPLGCAISLWLVTQVSKAEVFSAAGLVAAGYVVKFIVDGRPPAGGQSSPPSGGPLGARGRTRSA